MGNPRHVIINCLKSLQIRARIHTIIRTVTQTLFFAMCLLALLYVGIRLVLFPFSMVLVTLFVLIGAVLFGICFGFRNRRTLSEIACFVDEHLELKERVSTSLELIQENRQHELVELQILDSAEGVGKLDSARIMPYVAPPLLKWVLLPMLITVLSFTVPRQYELPQPPTVAEHEAIDKAIENLSDELTNIDNPNIREKIHKTIERLNNAKDVATVNEELRALNSEVREQKSEFPDESAIAQATQATQHFNGMDSTALTNELERLAGQAKLTPELRAELTKLFAKLAESVPEGELNSALDQIQGKEVSPDTLQDIVDALLQLDQLNQLEAQLTESRKDIALASIETDQSTGGVANSDGAPGQESGNYEAQGTQVSDDASEFSPSVDDTIPISDDNDNVKPLTGDKTPSLKITGNELKLNSETASDIQSFTRVFTGKAGNAVDEPDYMPFSDVVLITQREYAQAIENDRIPTRYRSQIKAYLEAIAKIDE